MDRLREVLLHVCVICSFVRIIAKVLDWYNPYMDFSGHTYYAQIILYFGVILFAAMRNTNRVK